MDCAHLINLNPVIPRPCLEINPSTFKY